MDLANKKCVPCEGGVDPFNHEQVQEYMKALEDGWDVEEDQILTREWDFPDFKSAMLFANKVGDIAEAEGHHPDLHVYWGKVVVDLWTHAIEGLSENDFIVAAKIDRIK